MTGTFRTVTAFAPRLRRWGWLALEVILLLATAALLARAAFSLTPLLTRPEMPGLGFWPDIVPARAAPLAGAVQGQVAPANPGATPAAWWRIGETTQGRGIYVARVGRGPIPVLLVGGIHGGREASTVALAQQLLAEYEHGATLDPRYTLFVLPLANPDGFVAGTRVNGRDVDLNRNWDDQWQARSAGPDGEANGGAEPFSEPESRALRDFIQRVGVRVVVYYHSSGAVVLAGANHAPSARLAQAMAAAAGYQYLPHWLAYAVSGDASDWATARGIVAVTVELSSDSAPDLDRNRAALAALGRFADRQFGEPH